MNFQSPPERIDPEHPYTLMYTSGTTGNSKGAIITSSNVLALLAA